MVITDDYIYYVHLTYLPTSLWHCLSLFFSLSNFLPLSFCICALSLSLLLFASIYGSPSLSATSRCSPFIFISLHLPFSTFVKDRLFSFNVILTLLVSVYLSMCLSFCVYQSAWPNISHWLPICIFSPLSVHQNVSFCLFLSLSLTLYHHFSTLSFYAYYLLFLFLLVSVCLHSSSVFLSICQEF